MNRKQFDLFHDYKPSRCCSNCSNFYDISEEIGRKSRTLLLCDNILIRCEENTDTRIDKYFVCDLWEGLKENQNGNTKRSRKGHRTN
jgi:hypothetical protein